VHKEFLMNQWADRIMDCYDIKKSDIGFVQQNVCEFEDKKIVMIMIQSLLARDYPKSMFDYFGTLCIDECHRIAAQEFRKAIVLFPARYRLGVTATPRRADKMENVFFWHIGNIVTIGEERRLKPRVKVIKTNLDLTHRDLNNMYDFRGKQNLNKVITYLIENDKRNRIIVSLIKKALKTGRKMMILSGRLDHLERLKIMMDMEMVKDGLRYTSGYYIGGMSEEERTISATRQLIFATVQMAAEGLDIPDLDTLFLVTPKSDIEQAVGRILRTYDGKKEPVVVDFSDPIEICVNMLKKRVSFYRKMRYMT
jgi:superfamily II DNA or RNA helicase